MKSIRFLIVFVVFVAACNTKYSNLENGLYAAIQIKKREVLVKLNTEEVPMTVANFVALAEGSHPNLSESEKELPFYNQQIFYRVVPNFMIQTGDPTGTGLGDAGFYFDDEFPSNEQGDLLLKHNLSGIVSMANSGPNTNSTHFFITHKPTPWLDGSHTVFGSVLKGQEVVDIISKGDVINSIEIIRKGEEAEKFNAPVVFLSELEKAEERRKERQQKIALARKLFQQKKGIDSAITTDSGLKILKLNEGTGKKVNPALPTTAHYILYNSDGKKIDASENRGEPIVFTLHKDPLIAGWKEGAITMKEGEKTRLFIPSYLGYGTIGREPLIAPDTDLILEIEILKVGK